MSISFPEDIITVPISFSYALSGAGTSAAAGNLAISAISYTGSAIDSAITAVTDISDPAGTGGWTTLVSLTDGPYRFMPNIVASANLDFMRIEVDLVEDSGDSLRLDVAIDGVTILDFTAVGNASANQIAYMETTQVDSTVCRCLPFNALKSFTISAARKGNFADAGSMIKIGKIPYWKIKV